MPYTIQNDNPKADKGSHPPGSLGSLTGHHVSILPSPNSKRTPLLPLLHIERQSKPVQELAFWPTDSSQDLYNNHKAYPPPMPEDWHNIISLPG